MKRKLLILLTGILVASCTEDKKGEPQGSATDSIVVQSDVPSPAEKVLAGLKQTASHLRSIKSGEIPIEELEAYYREIRVVRKLALPFRSASKEVDSLLTLVEREAESLGISFE